MSGKKKAVAVPLATKDEKQAHCLKCKSKQNIHMPVEKRSKKDMPYTAGKCGSCGTNVRTGNSKKIPTDVAMDINKY
jgi:hypothetical protein